MSDDISKQQEEVNRKIHEVYDRLEELENNEGEYGEELGELNRERKCYTVLGEISDQLEKLEKVGGSDLFWGEDYDQNKVQVQQKRIRDLVTNYDSRVAELSTAQREREALLESLTAKINLLNEESMNLQDLEQARMDEFMIVREMKKIPFRQIALPWNYSNDDDRRFRKILLLVLLVSLVIGVLVPMWNIPVPDYIKPVKVPERLAQLVVKQEAPPPPPKVRKKHKEEKKKNQDKTKPRKKTAKPDKIRVARKKASHVGLLAFKDDFADLLDDKTDKKLGASAKITGKGKGRKARKTTRSLVTANIGAGSGGINTASLSRNVGNDAASIGGVGVGHIKSSIGTSFSGQDRPLSSGPGPARTDEEIQIVFDRYKSALYRIYNRELRKDPTLQGKMVLKLTIEPDGRVSACTIDSSDMDSAELNRKIAARVKRFNFGAKAGVPTITILYPIDFLPAS